MNSSSPNWYKTLEQSPLTPPPIVFQIVWPVLYLMSFVGFVFFWMSTRDRGLGIVLFVLQLLVNLSWILVFFYLHHLNTSLVLILLLWGLLLSILIVYLQTSRVAFALYLPYFLWITFATYLNVYIVIHNE